MKEFEQNKRSVAVKERQEQAAAINAVADIDAEIKKLEHVVNSENAQSFQWNNLACLYFEKENFGEAEKCFFRALEIDEHNLIAQQNIADFFFSQKKYESAIQFYRKAAEKENNGAVQERMADCFAALGEMNAATEAYKKAFQVSAENESFHYKLSLIEAAKSGSSLRMDVPFFRENEIALVCYFSNTSQKRSVHFNKNGLIRLFEKLQNDRMELSIFHDEQASPNNSVFHFAGQNDFKELTKKHLFDVFLSINDMEVFNSDIPAVARILCVDNLQNESELNQLASLCYQGKIDTLIFEKSAQDKFSQRAWQQFENHSVVFTNFGESFFQHIEDSFIHQSLVHIEKFLLTDNPVKAKKILDKAMVKYGDREQFLQKQNLIEDRYPHLSDDVAYLHLYEKEGELTKFNEEIFNHACYVWLVDQLRRKKDILNILDVGCHKGEYVVSLANLGYQTTGLDISEYNIKFAETITPPDYFEVNQVEWVRGKARKLSNYFYADQFDAVILFQILEYVQDLPRVLNQIERVVKPKGHVFITVLANPHENVRNELFPAESKTGKYLRTFTREELRNIFGNQHHLKIQEIREREKRWYGVSFRLASPAGFVRVKYTENLQKTKTRLDTMFQTGCEYAVNGYSEKAFQEFMNIAEIFPNQGRALYNAGVISDQMGERDSAILLLNKVCEAFPGMVEAFNYLGKIYFQEEDYEEALKLFKKAFSLDESCETTLENLKMTANKLGLDLGESEFGE